MICDKCLDKRQKWGAVGYECKECGHRGMDAGNLKPDYCPICSKNLWKCIYCGTHVEDDDSE